MAVSPGAPSWPIAADEPPRPPTGRLLALIRAHPTVFCGILVLVALAAATACAPLLTGYDPRAIDPISRLKPPSSTHLLGTDAIGRDLWSRTIYGGRVSLIVGVSVAIVATAVGLLIGLVAGYNRMVDAIVMRVMDGLMA